MFYPFVDEKSQGEGDSTSDTAVAENELIDRFQFVKSVAIGKGRLKQNTWKEKRKIVSYNMKGCVSR